MDVPWKVLLKLVLALCLGTACTGRREDPISGDVDILLPWAESGQVLEPRSVRLRGLEDLSRMKGRFGHFEVDSQWTPEGLKGDAPKTRFLRNDDGVFIPMDARSGRLAITYAHLDRLSALEEALGLALFSPDPLRVAVDVKARGLEGPWLDNALYDKKLHALLFAVEQSAQLPLSINPGVVAHERFHALFARIVGRSAPNAEGQALHHPDEHVLAKVGGDEPMRSPRPVPPEVLAARYAEVYWNAVNEGFADLWGWIYSGDPDFMKRSLPLRGESRRLGSQRLDDVDLEWLSREKLMDEISRRSQSWTDPKNSARRFSYEVSIQLSRKIYAGLREHLGDNPNFEQRLSVAARLIRVLKSLLEIRETSEPGRLPELGDLAESVISSQSSE